MLKFVYNVLIIIYVSYYYVFENKCIIYFKVYKKKMYYNNILV